MYIYIYTYTVSILHYSQVIAASISETPVARSFFVTSSVIWDASVMVVWEVASWPHLAIEIVDFPMKNGWIFHGKMLVHQRVYR